jgi:hypothetical protein
MTKLMDKLKQCDDRKLIPVLAVTETIHNAEEAVWLPAWSQTAGIWHPPVGAFEFRFAVIAVALAVYGVVCHFIRDHCSGSNRARGVYFYRLRAGDFVQTREVLLCADSASGNIRPVRMIKNARPTPKRPGSVSPSVLEWFDPSTSLRVEP